eukprot:COSAG02_NODE_4487_length_5301_cov_2.865821_4_plen_45_part_00
MLSRQLLVRLVGEITLAKTIGGDSSVVTLNAHPSEQPTVQAGGQ